MVDSDTQAPRVSADAIERQLKDEPWGEGSLALVEQFLSMRYADDNSDIFGLLLLDDRSLLRVEHLNTTGAVDIKAVLRASVPDRRVQRVIVFVNRSALEQGESDHRDAASVRDALGLVDIELLAYLLVSAGKTQRVTGTP